MFSVENQGQRLEEVEQYFDLDYKRMANILGYSNANSYHELKRGGAKLTFARLKSLYEKFPSLNLHWLLTGEGEMLLSKKRKTQKAVQLMEV